MDINAATPIIKGRLAGCDTNPENVADVDALSAVWVGLTSAKIMTAIIATTAETTNRFTTAGLATAVRSHVYCDCIACDISSSNRGSGRSSQVGLVVYTKVTCDQALAVVEMWLP